MADITKEQRAQIKLLTRRANRRLERATKGQRKALEHYIGTEKFSAASKGMTWTEAQSQIDKLNRFLSGETSTRKGWDALKARQVAKANKSWGKMGYDLTDEELANILIQVDTDNHKEYYRAANLVQAAKDEAELTGEDWYGSEDAVEELLMDKMEAEDAFRLAKSLRQQVNEQRSAVAKKQKEIEKRRAQIGLRVNVQRGKRRKK